MTTLIPKYDQGATGAVNRPFNEKLAEFISVKDFGAIGTANLANEAADTAAFLAAMATGKNVIVPEGTYYVSETINVGAGQCLWGQGRAKTSIVYSGPDNGVYMGGPGNVTLVYDCDVRDFTINCTNRASTVNGVKLDNCVYFNVSGLSIFGSGSPNSSVPADRVLYGSGLDISNNSIIGRIDHTSTRIWAKGYYLHTLPASQSYWTAAICIGGQGEVANCMRGIVIGDITVPLYSGVGVSISDMSIQGCYTSGININSGGALTVQNCYFEGNANYDITVGSPSGSPAPINVNIYANSMSSEDIGVTPYGNFPYIAKIYVDEGLYTSIRDNAISSSSAIPMISLAPGSDGASISGNRVTGALPSGFQQILNNGVNTVIYNNHGYSFDAVLHPTLLNSWANSGAPYKNAQYQKFNNIFGQTQVMLNGTVTAGAAATIIFQLPAGYRPTGRIEFAVGGGVYNCVIIDSAGNVTCSVKGSSTVSLDGIIFIAEV